tara:strand:+ start:210 stop:539 length:330 start_codon:yes stop_codon:yes gene_type:complete
MNIKYNEEITIGGIEVTMSDTYNWHLSLNGYTAEELQIHIDRPEVMALRLGIAVTKHKQEITVRKNLKFEQYFVYQGMLCKAFHQKRGSDVTKGIHIDILEKHNFPNNK